MTTPSPNAPTPAGSWGRYRDSIESLVESCADYLGRLQRSLAGEIAPDRHYFNEKAKVLAETAQDLVHRGQDIERWVGECDETVLDAPEGPGAYCTLPIGHEGSHYARPAPSPAERACERARRLMTEARAIGNRIGWLATDIDLRRPEQRDRIADQREQVQELLTVVEDLGRDVQSLAGALVATDQGLAMDARLAPEVRSPDVALGPDELGR